MADHDSSDLAPDHAPGWLFRLNTNLGARLNAPTWMAPGTPASEARGATLPEPESAPAADRDR